MKKIENKKKKNHKKMVTLIFTKGSVIIAKQIVENSIYLLLRKFI
jgi:predicted nucleic acid-binding protein